MKLPWISGLLAMGLLEACVVLDSPQKEAEVPPEVPGKQSILLPEQSNRKPDRKWRTVQRDGEGKKSAFEIRGPEPLQWHDDFLALQEGDSFNLSVESNPTTGYYWNFEVFPADGVLEIVYDGFVMPSVPDGMCGVPGKHLLVVRARKAGTGKIRGAYRRSWEKDVKPVKVLDLDVKVFSGPFPF